MANTGVCRCLVSISLNDSVVRSASWDVINQRRGILESHERTQTVCLLAPPLWRLFRYRPLGGGIFWRCARQGRTATANSWALHKFPAGGDIAQKLWVWIRAEALPAPHWAAGKFHLCLILQGLIHIPEDTFCSQRWKNAGWDKHRIAVVRMENNAIN